VKEAIAKSYYSLQEDDDAKRITTEILKTDSNNEAAKIILGKIYFDKNELEKSKEIFQTFDKNTDNPEVLNFLGLFALDDLDFTEAIKDFSKALLSDKTNALYHYNLGNAYFFNGWYKEATTSYLNAIKYDSENLDYRYALAYLYYDMKNFDKSKSEVDYILSLNENHYRTRTLEAVLKLESNDFLGAEQILLTNIKSGFEDAFTDLTLAKVYSELLVFDKAESLLNKVIEQNPQNLDYEIELAKIYIKEKKYKEALIIAEKITESNENYIKAYAIGAQAAFELKNFEKTKDFAQNSILLDVNYATGYFWLSKVRIEENDLDEAVECMKRAIMYDLNNAYYYSEMSKIYEQKSDIKTALEYAKEAESLDNSTEYKILCSQLANQNRKNTNKLIKNLSSIQK
jgi:tetratricopeptide (TPR) repeat protein